MILESFNLEGKVAIVTGCNTGLGQGIAMGLAEAGCKVVGVNRTEPKETIEVMNAAGHAFFDVRADLLKQECIPGIIEKALTEFGQIDILVNNAGIIRREDAIEFSERNWDDVMNINTKTVFFMSQVCCEAASRAQGTGGKIINIASMLSFQGGIRVPSYTASKSAVMGYYPCDGERMGSRQYQCKCDSPRLYGNEQYSSICVKMLSAIKRFLNVFRLNAGVHRKISQVLVSS